jgi:hypothetical protein
VTPVPPAAQPTSQRTCTKHAHQCSARLRQHQLQHNQARQLLPRHLRTAACRPSPLSAATHTNQSPKQRWMQESRSGWHSGARSSTVTVTASLVASPTRCLAPASRLAVDISDWRLVQMYHPWMVHLNQPPIRNINRKWAGGCRAPRRTCN